MSDEFEKQEAIQIKKNLQEKAILGQVANLLVQENLINQEEELRFLACLKEDD